ncbi:DNA-binding response regulator [Vibrio sinensis]|uniref:DNA-binding response regulator n=1 Tax=Vibrio sinensis TaxID=2302434 RepID=A0A3A6QXE0_9VIBR|nr:response regulator [Vibrio sinensis]RJX75206.1 DNA-binding response regulator [Vibrio sinensis]
MTHLPHLLFIVDDDDAVRDALEFMLEGEGYQPLSFNSADAFWHYFQQQEMVCGCLILDSRMPGISGQELQSKLNQISSSLGIVFLTGHGDVPMAVNALKLGAVDFLQKPIDREALLTAITQAMSHSEQLFKKQACILRYQNLTQRERDMLALFSAGKNNIQIANELHISSRTVEVHKANLLRHLEVLTLADMVKIYAYIEPMLDEIPPPPVRIKRK